MRGPVNIGKFVIFIEKGGYPEYMRSSKIYFLYKKSSKILLQK